MKKRKTQKPMVDPVQKVITRESIERVLKDADGRAYSNPFKTNYREEFDRELLSGVTALLASHGITVED